VLKGATARRYAEAVFGLAGEQNTVDRWLQDLRLIAEYLSDHRLVFLLSEPNIQFNRKELVIKDLLNGKVQPEALNLALLLVERGLVELAPRVRDEYERKYNDFHNQIPANLTTAMPIDDMTRATVLADLQRLTGKKVLLAEQVDPTILGGAIARVGDTLIDGSVRRRLQLLRQQMQRGGTFTSQMDGVTGASNGASNGAVTGMPASGAEAPFVTGASETDTAPDGGPASATEMAPRRGQAPHMAPKSNNPGNGSPKNSSNSRKRGRRR
jgi:F-type H+-transporting ATPase subunit delta